MKPDAHSHWMGGVARTHPCWAPAVDDRAVGRGQAGGASGGGAHRVAAVTKAVNSRLGRLGQVFDVALDQVRSRWGQRQAWEGT